MSVRKGQSDPNEHPLSTPLNRVHLALQEFPSNLRQVDWPNGGMDDDGDGSIDQLNEYLQSLKNLLKTNASRLDEAGAQSDKVVLGQIARLLTFIADHRLDVGWQFVQLVHYVGKMPSHRKYDQPRREAAGKTGIPSRREVYGAEFEELMRGQVEHLEELFLRLSPPLRPELGNFQSTREACTEAIPPSDTYALENFVSRLRYVANRLREYDGQDEVCREFYTARQVLDLRYDIDEARHLLALCRDILAIGLFEEAKSAVDLIWDLVEQTRLSLVSALRIRPTDAGVIPTFMDKLIVRVSTRIDHVSECQSLIQDLVGKLQISLAPEKPAYESIGGIMGGITGGTTEGTTEETGTKQKEDVWEDVSSAMKKAIQDYWKESQAARSNGKRLLIGKFCKQRDLDEEAFRAEKDRVTRRKKRLK